VRELPQLVQLHQKYPERVTGVTVNMDHTGSPAEPPEALRESVLKLLAGRDATTLNILSSTPDAEVYEQLELAAVPAVLVYDQSGTLQKRFDNDDGEFGEAGFSYREHVVPLVEELLAKE
jgi:hypothetical protein